VHEEPPRLADAGWLSPLLLATMSREPRERWSMARVRDVLSAGSSAPVPTGVPARPPAADPAPTRQLSRPLPPPPLAPPVAPPAGGPVTVAPDHRGDRDSAHRLLPVLAAVVAVVAIGVLGWLAFTAGNGGDDGKTPRTDRTGGRTSSSSPSPSDTPQPTDVTADGMEGFVAQYLATVTSDPKAAWTMLTPDFQAASGGFGRYNSFWKSIETADVVSAQADPASRRVSYTVEYLRRDGSKATDDVTLTLQGTDGDYLISDEG
jgi:hypothetical protein